MHHPAPEKKESTGMECTLEANLLINRSNFEAGFFLGIRDQQQENSTQMTQIQQITTDLISANQYNQRHQRAINLLVSSIQPATSNKKQENSTQMTQIQQITTDLISVNQYNQRHQRAINLLVSSIQPATSNQ